MKKIANGTISYQMCWFRNLFGAVVVAAAWTITACWDTAPTRSPYHQAIYDMCLVQHAGNTKTCDASLRLLALQELRDRRIKDQAHRMVLAGTSKHVIVDWVTAQGLVGSDIAEAAEISLKELQDGHY